MQADSTLHQRLRYDSVLESIQHAIMRAHRRRSLLELNNVGIAIVLCVFTMLGWGSWANTQKASDRTGWPFPLFYWDYVIGVLLFSLVAAGTVGLAGPGAFSALDALRHGTAASIAHAAISGILFNLANLLLVVAIDAAGIAIAFPLGIGLALVLGTAISYFQTPKGNPLLIGLGVLFILLAMLLSGIAHRRVEFSLGKRGSRGPVFAIIAGCLMGTFYPQLAKAIAPGSHTGVAAPGMLTPLAALLVFSFGVLASNVIVNSVLMKRHGIPYSRYFRGDVSKHFWGVLGGLIWMFALTCNILASSAAGPAISYALGQGATLIAALWGVFVWKEFSRAPSGTWRVVTMMLLSYALGLILIGSAMFA